MLDSLPATSRFQNPNSGEALQPRCRGSNLGRTRMQEVHCERLAPVRPGDADLLADRAVQGTAARLPLALRGEVDLRPLLLGISGEFLAS